MFECCKCNNTCYQWLDKRCFRQPGGKKEKGRGRRKEEKGRGGTQKSGYCQYVVTLWWLPRSGRCTDLHGSVSFIFPFCIPFGVSGAVGSAHLRLLQLWATRLLSQWMLHWWRDNDSTARELFLCTRPSTSSTRPDRPQVSIFKFSMWPDWESNPTCQHLWRVLNQLYRLPVFFHGTSGVYLQTKRKTTKGENCLEKLFLIRNPCPSTIFKKITPESDANFLSSKHQISWRDTWHRKTPTIFKRSPLNLKICVFVITFMLMHGDTNPA